MNLQDRVLFFISLFLIRPGKIKDPQNRHKTTIITSDHVGAQFKPLYTDGKGPKCKSELSLENNLLKVHAERGARFVRSLSLAELS